VSCYYLVEFKTWIDTNKFSFMVGMVSRKFQEIHCRKLMKLVWRDLIPMMWANPVLVYSFTTSLLHQPYGRLKTHKSQLLWEIFKTQLNWTELNWTDPRLTARDTERCVQDNVVYTWHAVINMCWTCLVLVSPVAVRVSTIHLAILTQCRSVTDRRMDRPFRYSIIRAMHSVARS